VLEWEAGPALQQQRLRQQLCPTMDIAMVAVLTEAWHHHHGCLRHQPLACGHQHQRRSSCSRRQASASCGSSAPAPLSL
jgi:hypothetical protein